MSNRSRIHKFALLFSFLLAVAIGTSCLFLTGFAAYSGSIGVEGVSVSASSGSGTWNLSSGRAVCSINTTSKSSGCSGTTYTTKTSSITLKVSSIGVFSCSYSVTNYKSFSAAGTSESTQSTGSKAGSITKRTSANETFVFSFTSHGSNTNDSIMSITDISFRTASIISITCKSVPDTSYSVNGTTVNAGGADLVISDKTSLDLFELSCPTVAGKLFLGWYDDASNRYISTAQTDSLYCADGAIIYPRFASLGDTYQAGNYQFDNLDEACAYASGLSEKKVVLLKNAELNGNHTVYPGVTFVVPFDEAATTYTSNPTMTDTGAQSAFRTLTMKDGASIAVHGALSVPSKVNQNRGMPIGAYGAIKMEGESLISLESGAFLYCYGYIWGPGGMVRAKAGSTVYECFQLAGWRGGTATSGMLDNSQRVFPVNQYYVQNVEVPLRIDAGANEKTFTSITASSQTVSTVVDFIGDSGMFVINEGYIIKKYDYLSDRLVVVINGRANISYIHISLSVTLVFFTTSYEMKSEDYTLPIMGGMDISIEEGSSVGVAQDLAFFPDSRLSISAGATLRVTSGYSVYVYDQDDWDQYAYSNGVCYASRVSYTPWGKTYARSTDLASLEDAKVDINGTLEVSGGLYTTSHGASIISSEESGKVVFVNGKGTATTTYQAKQDNTSISYQAVAIKNARLRNGDEYIAGGGEEYFDTDTIQVNEDVAYNATYHKWGPDPKIARVFTMHFRDYLSDSAFTSEFTEGEPASMPSAAAALEHGFSSEYTIKRWLYVGAANVWYAPGQLGIMNIPTIDEEIVFEPFYGGFKDDKYYLFSESTLTVVSDGLFTLESPLRDTTTCGVAVSAGDTCLFSNGTLVTSGPNGESQWAYTDSSGTYWLDQGVVQETSGWRKSGTDWYCFDGLRAYKDTARFIDAEPLPTNIYVFDDEAKLVVPNAINGNGKAVNGNGEEAPYFGLFAVTVEGDVQFSYAKEDGLVPKNQTFYVSKTNGYALGTTLIEEGLYYFDETGYMYYGNSMLSDHSFERIVEEVDRVTGVFFA